MSKKMYFIKSKIQKINNVLLFIFIILNSVIVNIIFYFDNILAQIYLLHIFISKIEL